ncbi:MAG: hypothetical protein H7840_11530 [Alphaproteobacteria bacterium]
MEWKDYITAVGTVISALLVIRSWSVARRKDMENEKFKARLSRREELAKTFIAYNTIILETRGMFGDREDEATSTWLRLVSLMYIYGSTQEYGAMTEFAEVFYGNVHKLSKTEQIVAANIALNKLKNILIPSVRSELGFELIELPA